MRRQKTLKEEILKKVINFAMLYEQTLRNKKLLFISKSKGNKIEMIEVMFKKRKFLSPYWIKFKK